MLDVKNLSELVLQYLFDEGEQLPSGSGAVLIFEENIYLFFDEKISLSEIKSKNRKWHSGNGEILYLDSFEEESAIIIFHCDINNLFKIEFAKYSGNNPIDILFLFSVPLVEEAPQKLP
jgi:hypothetical protein